VGCTAAHVEIGFMFFLLCYGPQAFDEDNLPIRPSRHRTYVEKIEQASRREREEREQEVARRVRQTDCESVKIKVEHDLEQLASMLPNAEQSAIESAKDMKYLRERQA